MNRLLDPNRDGGYPLTGEALSILGADIPAYINAILEQITPDNSVVFLSDSYAYVKWSGYKEIMACTLTGRTQAQLMAGAKSQSAVTETNYSDTVSGTTYSNTRCSRVIAVSSSSTFQSGAPTFYDIESLFNKKLFNKVDYFNQIVISAPDASNVTPSGHAILKGGIVDILLGIEFTGIFETATITLPDALSTPIPIIANAFQYSPEGVDRYILIEVILDGTEIHVSSAMVDGVAGGYVSIHFQYMPIEPTPL